MAKTKTSKKKQWRFYRSQLATKIWDKEKNRLLADFSSGTFTTDDPRVAKLLIDAGYPQIDLDAAAPPEGVLVTEPVMEIEGDVPVLGAGVKERLGEAAIAGRMKPVGGPQPPKVIPRVE